MLNFGFVRFITANSLISWDIHILFKMDHEGLKPNVEDGNTFFPKLKIRECRPVGVKGFSGQEIKLSESKDFITFL